MGKISLVSAKYIVHAFITIEGVVDRPDVIGAIFGQTEGLLGSDLELRELQRSGRVGRIEVNTETKNSKTEGEIIVPSSLDKAETAIIAASLETIQRIGPCNASVKIKQIEDVRISKRGFVVDRAKQLLHDLTENVLPDSQEITEEVSNDVKVMGIIEYGPERLPAGPDIESSNEVILVEGRADVITLLKNGFKNAISMNGTNLPRSIIPLCKNKQVILFVDGDRGGDLIIKEVTGIIHVNSIIKAPDGKEVEELTKKEIHKSLRSQPEQLNHRKEYQPYRTQIPRHQMRQERPFQRRYSAPIKQPLTNHQKETFKQMLDDLVGTRGAYILDEKLDILGKVPTLELASTLKNLKNVFAVVFDGIITDDISYIAEKTDVKYLVGMSSEIHGKKRVETLISAEL
ncbi:MAG: DNA primase DnaG [Nanoarchaeota archaeon]|mgnify:CR=1 FL=1